ncbi:MAG TPA: tartrate-resistant acid phosphatase type 5 family protein [Puia sp.]|jgi:tartrate-resistant acid phosphatase type 5|nr:tartrate-resistant acid phosphatase type 5 family protein [Puia sp.]
MRFILAIGFLFFISVSSAQKRKLIEYDSEKEVKQKALRFIVFGDWGRNGEDNQKEVAAEMGIVAKKFKPEFIVSTGDNIYPNGVRSIVDHSWIASFENIYTAHSLQTDWFVVLGNHDYGGDPQAEIDYTKVDRRWNMPARYYSKVFYIGDDSTQGVLLVFIDTTPLLSEYYGNGKTHVEGQDTAGQRIWLEKTLKEAPPNIKWKFVFGHHPVYTGGGRMKAPETVEMKNLFKPIFEKYHVNAYICGHDHNLQYIKPPGFTTYFVSGAGSELSKTIVHPEGGIYAKAENGFINFSVYENKLQFTILSYTGEHLFTGSISRE